MTIALALACAGWCAGWLVGYVRRLPRIRHAPSTVSVIVPARNEAERLPALLAALEPRRLDVLVVDDDSEDATAAIAQAAAARVLHVAPPPGWTGKSWACWSGARAAAGDVLVFLDADTVLTTHALATLAAHASATGGLVSVQPRHRTVRAYEQLSAIPNLVAAMGAGTGPLGPARWWRRPAAFGMALAVPTQVYFAAGGHAAVRDAVAEDMALARAVDAAGAPVASWCGGLDGSVRMYGEGPRTLCAGWIKNLAEGAGGVAPVRLLCVVAWVAAVMQACILFPAALAGLGPLSITAAIAVYAAFALQTAILAERIGTFARGVVVALPVLVAAFAAMFFASVLATVLRRDISWRGRPVGVGARS